MAPSFLKCSAHAAWRCLTAAVPRPPFVALTAGTILATVFLRLVTATSWPLRTMLNTLEKLLSASSTVSDFMV